MPIDVASGNVHLEREDIHIPGIVDLIFDRRYSIVSLGRPRTSLGGGWMTRYDSTLERVEGGFAFGSPSGAVEHLADPDGVVERGGRSRNLSAFVELFKEQGRYIVQNWDVETCLVWRYCFARAAPGGRMLITSIEDVSGRGTFITRDPAGRVESLLQQPGGRRLAFAYREGGLLATVVLHGRNGERMPLVRYEYDSRARLTAAYDAAGVPERYEYDDSGRLHRELPRDGGVTSYAYDQKNRCIRTQGLDGYARKHFKYLEVPRITEITDSRGAVRRYEYLLSGQVSREFNSVGGVKQSEYDEHGRVTARADANGATTSYTYDGAGNRATVTNALGQTQRYEYNGNHQPVAFTDPIGGRWVREHDETNRLSATIDPLQGRWSVFYDKEGRVVEIENPLGVRRRQSWNGADLESIIDWAGRVTRFETDLCGRVTRLEEPSGEATQITYDQAGNPIAVALPDLTAIQAEYDQAGNMTRFRDANGSETRYRFGPCQRMLEQVDPVGSVVRYLWGSEPDQLDAIVNEVGETYRFHRDSEGRIVREQAFDGAERTYAYDADGYVIKYIDAVGQSFRIDRDALHRVVKQAMPDGEVAFAYDGNGSLVSAMNRDAAVTFERDPLGRVVRESQGEHWVASRYDMVGNLVQIATSLGHTVDYELDRSGQIIEATTHGGDRVRFQRNAGGREILRELPGAMVMEQHYDRAGRMIEQRVRGSGALIGGQARGAADAGGSGIHRRYDFTSTGSLASLSDAHWGRSTYAYDPAERLVEVVREMGASEAYSYDPASNITRIARRGLEAGEEAFVYGPGSRLLKRGSTHQYAYDADGRRSAVLVDADGESEGGAWAYEWNTEDRLSSITLPNGHTWRYRYDALGRRISKTGPSGETRFVWRGHSLIHEVADSAPHEAVSWVFGKDRFVPIASVSGGEFFSVVTDYLGTPREMIDRRGAVVWRLSYGPYGAISSEDGDGPFCPFRFQGQYHDRETGLHYNRFRFYDPETAAYTSQDPLVVRGGLNLYAYTANPTIWVDPLGLTSGYPVLAEVPYTRSYGDEMVAMAKPSTKDSLFQTHSYVNPGHHDPTSPSYIANRSVLPPNHVELFRNSVPVETPGGTVRWTREGSGSTAVYHRFAQHADGEFHWNGSTAGVTKSGRPRAIPDNHVPKCVK